MSAPPRRILTPSATRKRKEMEAFYAVKPPPSPPPPRPRPSPSSGAPATESHSRSPAPPSFSSSRLLAGYMAHEYLTKGTLLGQRWDPARAEAASTNMRPTQNRREEPAPEPTPGGKPPAKANARRSYAEVASLLKNEGAHIPGIFNPTQLARWIQM